MNKNEALDSELLKYKLNESIPIYEGIFDIFDENRKMVLKGNISLEWLPKPKIRFYGDVLETQIDLASHEDNFFGNQVKLKALDSLECNVMITGVSFGLKNNVSGIMVEDLSANNHVDVERVDFAIVNFQDSFGSNINFGKRNYLGRITLSYKEWRIIIDKRHDYSSPPEKIMTQLKNKGGYLITHLARIERADNHSFNTGEIESLIKGVHWLLSFASGRHVGVCLFRGIKQEEVVWYGNKLSIISNWKSNITWFPKQKAEILENIYPMLVERLEDDFGSRVFWEMLSWYIECHSDSIIENKLVSIQVALETLSWVYLVQSSQLISKRQYKMNTASSNIKYLLKKLNISTSIPEIREFENLTYDSGVHLLTAARNDVVHPEKKEQFTTNQKIKITQLGLWYIELSTLYLLEYQGLYTNRLTLPSWEGLYEKVPWTEGNQGRCEL